MINVALSVIVHAKPGKEQDESTRVWWRL